MKKKHTLLRNTLRSAWRTRERFLSLFGIIAISTGFFAGLKATSPDMKQSAEQYYRDTALMDLHLVSNAGFCDDELDALAERDDISQICGGYSETVFLPLSESASNATVQVWSLLQNGKKDAPQINQPVLTEGRMPAAKDECLIEVNTPQQIQVGDTVTLTIPENRSSRLAVTEYTVVGRADSSMYVDFQRGTTTIGNGSIDCFLLTLPDAFDSDIYTDVFLTLTETADLDSFSARYLTEVSDAADDLTAQAKELSEPRKEQILADADKELKQARADLDQGWQEYESGTKALEESLDSSRSEIEKARSELDKTREKIIEANEKYQASVEQYESGVKDIQQRQDVIDAKKKKKDGTIDELNEKADRIEYVLNTIAGYRNSAVEEPLPDELLSLIDEMSAYNTEDYFVSEAMREYFSAPIHTDQKERLEDTISLYLNNCKVELLNEVEKIKQDAEELAVSKASLRRSLNALANTKRQLDKTAEKLEAQEADYLKAAAKLDQQSDELDKTAAKEYTRLAEAKDELEKGETDYAKAVADAEAIADGIKWYAFDRSDNPGWSSYGEDADRVDRIARIFPVFFLLVASLVCLTTMTRMVEEQRTEIGTCRALGYSEGRIAMQFVMYAVIASVLGTAVGTIIGFQIFPRVIFRCYGMMYHFPPVRCPYHIGYALICLAASLLCTGIVAAIACGSAMREVPAMLMRPKPPKKGKRILLEKWRWFWSRCSFRFKVTIRNFFRYRSRVLMTVIGICGCTALLVTGFGLYHAIASIVDLQFGEIFVYDVTGMYDETDTHREILRDTLEHTSEISGYLFGMTKSGTVRANHRSYEVSVIVPDEPEHIRDFIVMRDRKTHSAIELQDDGIILNEKLAKLLGVSVGDSVTLADASKPVQVTGIMENYAMNRIFMTPKCCRTLFGSYRANCFFANETPGTDEDALGAHLLHSDALIGIHFTSQSGARFRELVKALGLIVAVIIIFSGLLAFAVLYNLANINILERTRELATLKVLGFYHKEVYAYIFRENILSSVCGMLCGLVAGIFLCRYVVQTAEVDVVMFAPDIPWYCFVFAAVMTLLFTVLVNLMLRGKLRRIDMAGSMKAIE